MRMPFYVEPPPACDLQRLRIVQRVYYQGLPQHPAPFEELDGLPRVLTSLGDLREHLRPVRRAYGASLLQSLSY